jgi:Arylsulfotransferase (ASST)
VTDALALSQGARVTDLLLKVWFWLGLVAIGFVWGVACMHFEFFPYSLLHEAKVAEEAWTVALEEEPTTFIRFEKTAAGPPRSAPVADQDADQGEFVLVGGGPFENLAECPGWGCMAWIVDRQGKVLHTWQIDPEIIMTGMHGYAGRVTPRTLKPHDWQLADNGELTVVFESIGNYPYGVGVARFDWDSHLLWFNNNRAHHWMTVGQDGFMYVPVQKTADSPFDIGDSMWSLECRKGGLEVDGIEVLDPSGKVVEHIDMVQKLIDEGYVGLLGATTDHCDPLHLNLVQIVDPDLASKVDALEPGDLIVSLRNLNTLVVLGAGDRHIKWMFAGQASHAHAPRPDHDGDIVLFDNLGGPREFGGSRLARVRVGGTRLETLFPTAGTDPGINFYSKVGGTIEWHPRRNRALVGLTSQGRVLELDLDSKQVLWDYEKQFPSTDYPGADDAGNGGPFVRVEAYGAYYVSQPSIIDRLHAQPRRNQ